MSKFGTELHKIIRKDAPDTSVDAAHKVDTAKDEEIVFKHICNSGKRGLTNRDLVDLMGKPMNTFSGRITALLEKGMVEDSGKRRDRCRVIVASKVARL